MLLNLPKTLIIDTNFFVSFYNTENSMILKEVADSIRSNDFTVFVPAGVLSEVKYLTNQKLPLIISSAFKIEEVNYENQLYKEIRQEAIGRNCFSIDERVDIEILYLAHKYSQNQEVGVVSFDMGFERALEVVPILKNRAIKLVMPWTVLFEIYKLSDFSLRKKLKNTIVDIYYYFHEFRIKERRKTKDMITEIVENATSSLDLLALLNFELPQEEFFAIEKYLNSEPLSDNEKEYIRSIKDILDGVKLARDSSDVRTIELGLDIAFSQLENRYLNKPNEERLKIINILSQLTNQVRVSLIQKYVSHGNYKDALKHIEILRILNLFNNMESNLEITNRKMHTLNGFLHILQGNYEHSLIALEGIKNRKDLDQDELTTLLVAYIATKKEEETKKILEEVNIKHPQATEDLLDLAHNLIIAHRYELAARILLAIKDCKYLPRATYKEKISILLQVGNIDKALKEELKRSIGISTLDNHTNSPLDKTLYCDNCNVSDIHSFFKDRLIITDTIPNPDESLVVKVWSEKLKSMLGLIVPASLKYMIKGALSVKITGGKIRKIRGCTLREKKLYNVRGLIVLSDETIIEPEKWKGLPEKAVDVNKE